MFGFQTDPVIRLVDWYISAPGGRGPASRGRGA
jgi:hypothetical protein